MAGALVRSVAAGETEAAAVVLANAFADDPVFRYIMRDRGDIERRIGHVFGDSIATELRKPSHLVQRTEDGHAVALWHEVDDWETPPIALVRSLPSTVRAFGTSLPRALSLLLAVEKVHPAEPHRHLAFIGTHDKHKGNGQGSALLRAMTEECDEQGIAAYLENTNPRNEAWYARFGFESRGPIPLPDGAPVITAMWRVPR